MSATPERKVEPLTEPAGGDADQLRALVSAMLGGTYQEEVYLWDVVSLCRANPEFARQLLALIDRYQRLGQMPAAQHRRIRQKIEQSLGTRDERPAAGRELRADTQRVGTDRDTTSTAAVPAQDAWPTGMADPTVTTPLPAASPTRPPSPPAKAPQAKPTQPGPTQPGPPQRSQSEPPNGSPSPSPPRPPAAVVVPTAGPQATLRAVPPEGSPPSPAARSAIPPPAAVSMAPAPPAGIPPASARPAGARPAATPSAIPPPAAAGPAVAPARDANPGAVAAATATPGTTYRVLRSRYELQSLLGAGGMASVYKALDRYRASLGLEDCWVALKIINAQPAQPAAVAALGREFHHAQLLSHPNVVNVYEIDHEGDASFYTMELLEGERLSQLCERIGGPLPPRQALAIIRDIGAAIAHAHSRAVVHGDLKPHNVFVTFGGQVRVLDFGGLSPSLPEQRSGEPSLDAEHRGFRAATPAYASCEQLEGWRAEPCDDIYALACVAYELLTGRHPYGGKSSLGARAQRLRPRRPGGLGSRSWHALRRGLSWQRDQRPEQVGPWLERLGVAAAVEHLPPSYQLAAAPPRSPWPGRVAAAVVLACLGAVAFALAGKAPLDWYRALASAATLQSARYEPPAASTTPVPAGTGPSGAAGAAGAAAAPGQAPVLAAALASPPGAAPPTGFPPIARHSTASARAVLPDDAAAAVASVGASATAADLGIAFAASSYAVQDDAPAVRLTVRRIGGSQGDLRFAWWTVENSAKADVDYAPLGLRTETIPRGEDDLTIYVPIISNPLRHETTTFYVALGPAGASDTDAPSAQASVTIVRGG